MSDRSGANRRFAGYMLILFVAAGLGWAALAYRDYRETGRFAWGGLVMFFLLIAAMTMLRSRPPERK